MEKLYQIIINHWGLSLGEIETISNLFKNYELIETEVQKNGEYASNIEIEFVKNMENDFFNCISIDKWNIFVDIIKNIKKRRGNKGLKFKVIITDCFEDDGNNNHNLNDYKNSNEDGNKKEVEIELLFFRRIIFILGHKHQSEFVKGVERIEITIENITEAFNKNNEFEISEENTYVKKSTGSKSYSSQIRSHKEFRHLKSKIQLYVFVFDNDKRIWKPL